MTLEAFTAALDAYGAADTAEEISKARALVQSVTPAGLLLNPSHTGHALNVHTAENPGVSSALFYLNFHRSRRRDPVNVRLAYAAVVAMGEAMAATLAPVDIAAVDIPPAEPWESGYVFGWRGMGASFGTGAATWREAVDRLIDEAKRLGCGDIGRRIPFDPGDLTQWEFDHPRGYRFEIERKR